MSHSSNDVLCSDQVTKVTFLAAPISKMWVVSTARSFLDEGIELEVSKPDIMSKSSVNSADDTNNASTDQDSEGSVEVPKPKSSALTSPSHRWRLFTVVTLLLTLVGLTISLIVRHIVASPSTEPAPIKELECYASFPHLEYMTSNKWWNNSKPPTSQNLVTELSRFQWIQARQPFEPIFGDDTTVAGVVYTLSNETLKMTVLFPPLYPQEGRTVNVYIRHIFETVIANATCEIQENTWHCPVRVSGLDPRADYTFEVHYKSDPANESNPSYNYTGEIPRQVDFPRVTALSCFGRDDTKDKTDLIRAIVAAKPNILALQGDQTYMNVLGYGFTELIYSINSLTRRMPTLVQMDDHDYGEGNLWGASDAGETSGDGFSRPPCIVNAVQRLSMSHMPDPASDIPLANGIDPYYTSYQYGLVDFALLEARKYKSRDAKADSETLLGQEQEEWLTEWCSESKSPLRIILTQTPFASLATNITLPGQGGFIGEARPRDTIDTNAYPTSGRQRFMEIAKGCSSLILSGDQHLGLAVAYDDFGISECASPAAINDQFWRLNFEAENSTVTDYYNEQHRILRAWNVEETVWRQYRPVDTRYANDTVKAARGDGFLMVDLDGETATCEMHGYRQGPDLVWAVTVPAKANET